MYNYKLFYVLFYIIHYKHHSITKGEIIRIQLNEIGNGNLISLLSGCFHKTPIMNIQART